MREMTAKLVEEFEKTQVKEDAADVRVGDILQVFKTIIEGKKKRVQRFEGTVIKVTGIRNRRSFTVRKVLDGVGVEKTFLLHSPLIEDIKIIQRSKVRRSRLFYLRNRIGSKANRLKVKES